MRDLNLIQKDITTINLHHYSGIAGVTENNFLDLSAFGKIL